MTLGRCAPHSTFKFISEWQRREAEKQSNRSRRTRRLRFFYTCFSKGGKPGNHPALMHVKDKLTESMDLLIWVLGF